jgi:trans-2,3-dihydro-3-hydroxyanthranilate isomerase
LTRVALPILQVDAFTDRPFGGNPAGVVLDGEGLDEGRMQAIAAEMNVAETAFVSTSTRADADFRLRWFTPGREVTYCGHATVATVHAMVEGGRLAGSRVSFDTKGGLLHVEVDRGRDGATFWLVPPLPALSPFAKPLDGLVRALGLAPEGLAAWAPPAVTPEGDLLLPAAGLEALRALAPDMSALGRLADEAGLRGVVVIARERIDAGSGTHTRFFAPHFGIPEDPVTGSVHSSIAVWLFAAGHLPVAAGRAAFTGEQGDMLGRPGRLRVEVDVTDGRPQRVRVGGRAVTVLEGRLLLPE